MHPFSFSAVYTRNILKVFFYFIALNIIFAPQEALKIVLIISAVEIISTIAFMVRGRLVMNSLSYKRANSADELMALASHQLRTPATGVKQYLNLVLSGYAGDISDSVRRLLEKANLSNERQLEIITMILYTAKADNNQLAVTKEDLALNKLIDEIIEEQTDELKSKQQKISVKIPRKFEIWADKRLITIVLENLLTNAVKYSPDMSRIGINASTDDNCTTIKVVDNGVGIEEKDFRKLFKKFVRIDNELSGSSRGNGIGLYLTKKIVELHGGHIEVKSKMGEGSTFSVILPNRLH